MASRPSLASQTASPHERKPRALFGPAPLPATSSSLYVAHRANPHSGPAVRHGSRRLRRFATALGIVLTVIGGAAFADQRGLLDRDRIATGLGFGIEQVSLTGHRFTSDADLFDALDLNSARSLVSFDAETIRKRFERLPWVQSVDISRVWPDQLAIRVTERKAFAIWEQGDAAQLIDATGRVLGPVKRDAPLDLPRIAGVDANAAASLLFTALDRHHGIKARVARAVRLGGRRWTLELSGGGRIHLPSDGEASALARLAADPQLVAMVESSKLVIDLRSTSRIAFRPAGPTTGADGGGRM